MFDKALNGGEGFSLASRNCTQFCMALFDEGCAGMFRFETLIPLAKMNQNEGKRKGEEKFEGAFPSGYYEDKTS